jgi:hypothetical protein
MQESPAPKKILTFPLRVLVGIFILGMLVKIMHWAGGNILIITGLSAIAALYPFRFYKKENKRIKDYIKLILVLSWAFSVITGTLHLPYDNMMKIIPAITFWIWLGAEAYDFFILEKKEHAFSNYSVWSVIATAFILTGILLKILHWPFANILLILGFVCLVAWFIKDSLQKNKE